MRLRFVKRSDVCKKLENIFIAINKDIKIRNKHHIITYLYLKIDMSLYRLDQNLDELLKHGVP